MGHNDIFCVYVKYLQQRFKTNFHVHVIFFVFIYLFVNIIFIYFLQRPPSSSLSGYGLHNDDARSPSSGGGTPGLMPPGSHLSGDNISEAGRTTMITLFQFYFIIHFQFLRRMCTFPEFSIFFCCRTRIFQIF